MCESFVDELDDEAFEGEFVLLGEGLEGIDEAWAEADPDAFVVFGLFPLFWLFPLGHVVPPF